MSQTRARQDLRPLLLWQYSTFRVPIISEGTHWQCKSPNQKRRKENKEEGAFHSGVSPALLKRGQICVQSVLRHWTPRSGGRGAFSGWSWFRGLDCLSTLTSQQIKSTWSAGRTGSVPGKQAGEGEMRVWSRHHSGCGRTPQGRGAREIRPWSGGIIQHIEASVWGGWAGRALHLSTVTIRDTWVLRPLN